MTKRMLVKLLWYFDIGRDRVISRGVGFIIQLLTVITCLKVYEISLSLWQIILMGFAFGLTIIVCGVVYTKLGLFKIEVGLSNEQNELLQELRKNNEISI